MLKKVKGSCMSLLISFVSADASCEARLEGETLKKGKILAHTRTHNLSFTRLAL